MKKLSKSKKLLIIIPAVFLLILALIKATPYLLTWGWRKYDNYCKKKNMVSEMEIPTENESTLEISADTDISLSVKTANSNSLELEICNETSSTIFWGQWYVIEKRENNTWYQLQEIELEENVVFGWEDILYSLKAGEIVVENENWSDYYGILSEGDYRIIKSFYYDERKQDENIYIACEFSIE